MSTDQLSLLSTDDLRGAIKQHVANLVLGQSQPSAADLLAQLEKEFGWAVRWDFVPALRELAEAQGNKSPGALRAYVWSLLHSGDAEKTLCAPDVPDRQVVTGIDALVKASTDYRGTKAFTEMVDFMGRFREYSPYNNMLVRVQNPSCCFYAREKDWWDRFKRRPKEDARPMIILAPMHPVMLVYDLDDTEGEKLPEELARFSSFEGTFKADWLDRMVKNAEGHGIHIEFRRLSSTHGGFAQACPPGNRWKMRIVVHDGLDGPSRVGVLCHELAHILLGHLGTDRDLWWPFRRELSHRTVEIEAEAVAYIVTTRLDLTGTSAEYVSRHIEGDKLPDTVSVDMIAKVASKIERMALENMTKKQPRKKKGE